MKKSNIEVRVLVDDKPVREFCHDGKLFVNAKEGSEYKVKIKNDNNFKILAVISVDGIDIQTGKEANYNGPGYIINGLSSYEAKGYRKSLEEVGSFKFTKKDNSYSKEVSGKINNCGIISVAIFSQKINQITNEELFQKWKDSQKEVVREKEYVPYPIHIPYPVYPDYPDYPTKPYYKSPYWVTYGDNVNTSYSCGSIYNSMDMGGVKAINYAQTIGDINPNLESEIKPSFDLGSTWGKKIEDKVIEASFERGNLIGEFNIFYASKECLQKMGIKMDNEAQVSFPNGFPGQFCKPPSGWKS
jgi:hypothetical protein